MTVSLNDMRDTLLTVDVVREILATTEPVTERVFSVGSDVRFTLGEEWVAQDEEEHRGSSGATITLGGVETPLTREAVLEATSIAGIPKGYASRTPGNLVQDHLNYWFGGGLGAKDFKILDRDGLGVALTRASIQPYSNLRFLDEAVASIQEKWGVDQEILVDSKFTHGLQSTRLRLILPHQGRTIENTGTDNDIWSIGVSMQNSQVGMGPTEITGYLFRWTCANGAISTTSQSGVWRRVGVPQDEVYEWARRAVDDILGGLEPALDLVQATTEIPVASEAVKVLRDVFAFYNVPLRLRSLITEAMVEATQMTMYEVMQAVTQAANAPDMDPKHADQLMRVGGDLPHRVDSRCGECHRIQH